MSNVENPINLIIKNTISKLKLLINEVNIIMASCCTLASLIFYLSAQPVQKSNGLSKKVTKVVVETAEKVAPEKDFNIGRINHLLRKNAHFFLYLALGILLMNGLRVSGVDGWRRIAIALAFYEVYAISDEFHQLFVSGREAQVKDVLIDTDGAILGIGMCGVVGKMRKS